MVTPQREAVERVGSRLVGLRYLQVGLRRGKAEEVVGRLCRHQLHGLGILLACLAEAHRLDAAVPLQRVVAEEVLLIGEVERLHIVGCRVRAQEVEAACRAAHLEGTAREPHVLRHAEREVRLHVVLSHVRHRTVGRGHIVRRAVQVGVAPQRQYGQVVGAVVAIGPVGRLVGVACRHGIGRLRLCHLDDLGQRQRASLRLCLQPEGQHRHGSN